MGLDKVAEALSISGFMKPWVIEKIKSHLVSGGMFLNRGSTAHDDERALVPNGLVVGMAVRSEYRMATEAEILDYVDNQQFANVTGRQVSKRSQEKGYVLHYHEGAKIIAAYDDLPRQAKVVLDVLNDTGRENFTEASIDMLLTEKKDLLKTKQDPLKIFAFYRRRFIDEGHMEEVDDD